MFSVANSKHLISFFIYRNEKNENVKGVPDFWLTIFKNVAMLAEMVQEHDEPILKHLQDIKVIFSESNPMVSTDFIELVLLLN